MIQMPETIEELALNPEKYGMPTFEQFVKNKDRYVGRQDDEIAAIDRGDPVLGCTQKYLMETDVGPVTLDSIEQADRIAREMGLSLFTDFIACPQIRDDKTLRRGFYNEVTFRTKESLKKRDRW